jgi:hypothetical protein
MRRSASPPAGKRQRRDSVKSTDEAAPAMVAPAIKAQTVSSSTSAVATATAFLPSPSSDNVHRPARAARSSVRARLESSPHSGGATLLAEAPYESGPGAELGDATGGLSDADAQMDVRENAPSADTRSEPPMSRPLTPLDTESTPVPLTSSAPGTAARESPAPSLSAAPRTAAEQAPELVLTLSQAPSRQQQQQQQQQQPPPPPPPPQQQQQPQPVPLQPLLQPLPVALPLRAPQLKAVPVSPQSSPVPASALLVAVVPGQSRRQQRRWTPAEVARLNAAVSEHGDNWAKVAKEVDSHSSVECQRKFDKEVAAGRLALPEPVEWSEAELGKLRAGVEAHSSNWKRVAAEVASSKTADDCRRQAFQEVTENKLVEPFGLRRVRHKRTAWSTDEVERLHQALEKHGRSWTEVAAYVRTRSNEDCRKKSAKEVTAGALPEPAGRKKAQRPAQYWFREEMLRLKEAVKKHGRAWDKVAEHVGGTRTAQDCINKVNKEVAHGRMNEPDGKVSQPIWSAHEVEKLREGVMQYGRQWVAIAAHVGSRTAIECRLKTTREIAAGRSQGLLNAQKKDKESPTDAPSKQQVHAQQTQLPHALDTDPKGGWVPAFPISMQASALPPPLPLLQQQPLPPPPPPLSATAGSVSLAAVPPSEVLC